jgi:hypothetical protein
MLTLAHAPYTSMTALAPPGGLVRRLSIDLRLHGHNRSVCQRLPSPLLLLRFNSAERGLLFVKFGWNKLMYELERIINFLH